MAAQSVAYTTTYAQIDPVRCIPFEAFDHLVVTHQRRIHRIILTLLRDGDAAETFTQEVFLRAFEKRATFRGEASLGTWLVRIAVNLARDYRRNRRLAFWRCLVRNSQPHDGTDAVFLTRGGTPPRSPSTPRPTRRS